MKKYVFFCFILVFASRAFLCAQTCVHPDTAQAIIIFTASDRPPVLESEFSISPTTKVRFASGNLLYQPSTKTWRLAPRQYDIVGGECAITNATERAKDPEMAAATKYHGTIWEMINGVRTKCTNDNNHKADYAGWIDLFPWGTSGWYGTETGEADPNATEPQRKNNNPGKKITAAPWEVNNGSANYKLNNDGSQGMTGAFANADWGVFNNIQLGGTPSSVFRAPTQEEATYLLGRRPNAKALRARARIRIPGTGSAPDTLINGIILLPDDWDPAILPSTPIITDEDGIDHWYKETVISASDFDNILEPQGAIFLPAAGGMSGTKSIKCNRSGYYWGATPIENISSNLSYDMQFGGYGQDGNPHQGSTERKYCRSVRLVQDVQE